MDQLGLVCCARGLLGLATAVRIVIYITYQRVGQAYIHRRGGPGGGVHQPQSQSVEKVKALTIYSVHVRHNTLSIHTVQVRIRREVYESGDRWGGRYHID